jgi:hypothetical protein
MNVAHVHENTTRMSSTLTEQMSLVPSAIMTNLTKLQPNNTLVANLFHSNTIESTRRPIHDWIIWSTKIHQTF